MVRTWVGMGWAVRWWTGTYYRGRCLVRLGVLAGLAGYTGWPWPGTWLGLTESQSQDPARVFPSSQSVRVIKQRRGGSAKPLLRVPPLAKYRLYSVFILSLEDLTPGPTLAGKLSRRQGNPFSKALRQVSIQACVGPSFGRY